MVQAVKTNRCFYQKKMLIFKLNVIILSRSRRATESIQKFVEFRRIVIFFNQFHGVKEWQNSASVRAKMLRNA